MKEKNSYIRLQDLEVYKLSREMSRVSWVCYEGLSWQDKKVIGDQFIRAVDSVGANIAEGYGRYHYLDKIKFFYNARGSLVEAIEHWLELLLERSKITNNEYTECKKIGTQISLKLQNLITSMYKVKEKGKDEK